ncbi:hypothetical protein KC19_2G064900 [Ceratodon purpureus]|uniref:BZIP domain-containing protein n=1 Tax=Ceratodon purpureus TaxID=3225 RepID=A0A8T0IQU6_CERPU|nr:hypothetical protein KC19_2G064900 [Ceratodon purpureus]
MCHGLIDKRACVVTAPDLLRAVSYQESDYDKYTVDVIDFPSVDNRGCNSLLRDSDLSDDALTDIVNDYTSAEKFDSEDIHHNEADTFASTWLLSTWIDCIKVDEDPYPAENSVPTMLTLSVAEAPKGTSKANKDGPKSRKAHKPAAVKEQRHAQHDSEMDEEDPVLIDEKRKRRMTSNRASAQRSRQRRQGRLDELEILTAQLRLENATLARRAKFAEELAKKFQTETNVTATKVEELKQELEVARHSRAQSSPDSEDESKDVNSGVCNMVEEGGSSRDTLVVKLETSSKGYRENVPTNSEIKIERNTSGTDLSGSIFQELYDAIDSDQYDGSNIGGEVTDLLEEEWIGSFTDCLNA